MKKTLAALLTKHPDKVDSISDESFCGDGYWVYLKAGWRCGEVHCVHEWNMADLKSAFRSVEPCDCADCRAHKPFQASEGTLAILRGRK
jgi:hypothetical protein